MLKHARLIWFAIDSQAEEFQGQEIAFITWYLVYFLCMFQYQMEVMVGVDPRIGWGRSLWNGTRINTTWKENPVYKEPSLYHSHTHSHSHKLFISAAVSIYLLKFSFTCHALCLGSLLPA
jgi:hypothetical protein